MTERHPQAKTPPEEYERRIIHTVTLLKMHYMKSEVKRKLKEEYSVSARTCESYISEARKLLIDETNLTKEEHVADAYVTYNKIISDPLASHKDKIAAQNALNKLLGLNKPQTIAQTDKEGNDVDPGVGIENQIIALVNSVSQRIGKTEGD